MPDASRQRNSPSRRLAAVLLAVAGLVVGWLVVGGVLALPLSEGALFTIAGLVAVGALVCACYVPRWWVRALMLGGVVGVVLSVALVLVVVKS